jgi:hypothetical protein
MPFSDTLRSRKAQLTLESKRREKTARSGYCRKRDASPPHGAAAVGFATTGLIDAIRRDPQPYGLSRHGGFGKFGWGRLGEI